MKFWLNREVDFNGALPCLLYQIAVLGRKHVIVGLISKVNTNSELWCFTIQFVVSNTAFYDQWFNSIVGGYKCYMGRDKYENEDLIAYGWPEDVW